MDNLKGAHIIMIGNETKTCKKCNAVTFNAMLYFRFLDKDGPKNFRCTQCNTETSIKAR